MSGEGGEAISLFEGIKGGQASEWSKQLEVSKLQQVMSPPILERAGCLQARICRLGGRLFVGHVGSGWENLNDAIHGYHDEKGCMS